jgi:hypothetical protein
MEISALKDWLVPVSTFVTLITASVGGWMSLREYRLKVQAETRFAKSSELEADVKLLKLFTEIMSIAHARGNTEVSEKVIEKLLSPEAMKELGITIVNLRPVLENSVIMHPVGVAAQDSAIAAIWALGNKHEILKPVAIQALTSLSGFKANVARPYLDDLRSQYGGKALATAEHEQKA